MDATHWDARYRASELVWGLAPNRFVAAELADLPPGRALDVACGEGRNAIWLASRGWHATGLDFSDAAIDRARRLATEAGVAERAAFLVADVVAGVMAEPPTTAAGAAAAGPANASAGVDAGAGAGAGTSGDDGLPPTAAFDAVVVAYLQLPADARRAALRAAAGRLAPGGTLLVVAHDATNLTDGVGGPRDASVLYTPDGTAADLADIPGLVIEKAARVPRPVETPDGEATAIDTLVRARLAPA
ncbi:class I SAM-dependent methyltransferase [Pseudofrankia sp. BMG5.37]|uniref:SAM-dependent methyltransferase n=1 Tax=Pseudofrankia sp. BMG5.37 TaxID=3050035 RepID=UPI002896004F|nr:class I SAM-dependent methyltransferase [Pseudofrankia sp. BMG5.37]MDT3443370.1 class I SAM-dependent methyltransferase [Pseudofrankia sp. BMG5.37]